MDNIDKILKKMDTIFQKALSRMLGSRVDTERESDIEIELRWNQAFPHLDVFKTPPHMRKSPRLGEEEEEEEEEESELGMPPD